MATDVEVCNVALGMLKARRILSFDDDTSEGRLCRDLFTVIRDRVLSSHPWNFAVRRVALGEIAGAAPAFGFTHRFQVPSDCLRVLDVSIPNGYEWKKEGSEIVTNYDSCSIKYIWRNTDLSSWNPYTVELLAAELAVAFAYPITQSTSLRSEMRDEAKIKRAEARSFDGQETGSPDAPKASEWLNARF